MISKIDIKNYEKQMQEGKYEEIYIDIVNQSMELIKEIGKIKNFEFPEDKEGTELYQIIELYFKQNFGQFKCIFSLMENLSRWYYEEDCIVRTEKEKIDYCIEPYNTLIEELELYKKIEREIEEKGFEKILEKRKKQLKNIFIEMLEYKNIPYDKKWNTEQFIEKIIQYYNYYSNDLRHLEETLHGKFIMLDMEDDIIALNDVERVMLIDEIYDSFIAFGDNDGYKQYAYFYRDFELEEGQTYRDLYNLEKEKLIKLFKEMLEYVGEKTYKDEKDLKKIMDIIIEKYPFYEWRLTNLFFYSPYETYIETLNQMENIYEYLAKDYKNYEKNILEYEKNI